MERFDLLSSETPQGYYMSRWSGEEIDKAITAASMLGQADSPQQVLANLGAGVRLNLLDNPYFVGGGSQQGGGQLPINQMGGTTYSGNSLAIDRWKTVSNGSILLDDDGITLTQSDGSIWVMAQVVEPSLVSLLRGQQVTVSAVDDQNNLYLLNVPSAFITETSAIDRVSMWCSSSGSVFLGTNETSVKLVCVKLEVGPTQTLAYQDKDGDWHLLPQPDSDYGTQLAKCQKYLFVWNGVYYFASGNGGFPVLEVSFPSKMRITPTITDISTSTGVQAGFNTNQDGIQFFADTQGTLCGVTHFIASAEL